MLDKAKDEDEGKKSPCSTEKNQKSNINQRKMASEADV